MIVREWRARAGVDRASASPEHFREVVVPKLRVLPGFVSATLLSRPLAGQLEFVVLTRWTSLARIHAFAGPEIDTAVVDPVAETMLASFDSHVQHYEVLAEAGPATDPSL